MLKAANRAVVRLWKDESGVVLALTVIVFLTLFMMACSVFAVGETIRQRIELQNAADAAAYSAAIVQADCVSRVAAVNRAMSWTYVQMVRQEMDYIVDKWLYQTLEDWKRDNKLMESLNMPSSCNQGRPYYGTGSGVHPYSYSNHERIRLNGHQYVTVDEIRQARDTAANSTPSKSYTALANPIQTCRTNIKAMNAKEADLISKLPKRIRQTVEAILKSNITPNWNDGLAGGAKISYLLEQEDQDPHKNFAILKSDEEENDFLRHSNYIPEYIVPSDEPNAGNPAATAEDVFGPGSKASQWFVKDAPGMQRHYQHSNKKMLIAEWDWFSSLWEEVDGACVGSVIAQGSSSVMGDDPRIYLPAKENYITELAEPRILKREFFNKQGSIVVGLTRRLNNPLQFMVGGGALGVFKPFTLDNGNRRMWTASAARAGYNPPQTGKTSPDPDCGGKYEETWIDKSGRNDLWNLKTSDWDATLLPLHVAWVQGHDHVWDGASAGKILNELKNGSWTPLYGDGDDLGAQGAPRLINKNSDAEVNYLAAEGWVTH